MHKQPVIMGVRGCSYFIYVDIDRWWEGNHCLLECNVSEHLVFQKLILDFQQHGTLCTCHPFELNIVAEIVFYELFVPLGIS